MDYFRIFLISLMLLVQACSIHPQRSDSALARSPAQQNLHWVAHPCHTTKGAPFRKYQFFAYDEENSQIWAKTRQQSSPALIAESGRQGRSYKNLNEFLSDKGISQFCNSYYADLRPVEATVDEEDVNPSEEAEGGKEEENTRRRAFVKPIQFNPQKIYASLQRDSQREIGIRSVHHNKLLLEKFLSSSRVQHPTKEDRIAANCSGTLKAKEICVEQIDLGNSENSAYRYARQKMMGLLDLRQTEQGEYEIFDYYCQRWVNKDYFIQKTNDHEAVPGLDRIVHSQVINCEHTWPQSKFVANKNSHEFIRQKTDWNHIFSTDTIVNRDRANFEFAEVDLTAPRVKFSICSGESLNTALDENSDFNSGGALGPAIPVRGLSPSNDQFFEPPKEFKGQIARALFYFSVRYNAGMSPVQEYYLRQWHKQYPVTDQERIRNEGVYLISGVRNPFIDLPEWADRIQRFCRHPQGLNMGGGRLSDQYLCEDQLIDSPSGPR